MPNEKFEKAMYFVEISEGGTSTNPHDRGGYTKFGISEREYPNIDIENLTHNTARQIYYNDYWLKNSCDSFKMPLSIVLFDSSVNCGQASAAKWLQKTITIKGTNIAIDGIIGQETIAAANMYEPMTLVVGIVACRLRRYSDLLKNNEQYTFIRGWINRVSKLCFYVL